jgi:hypothetical protein
MKNEADDGKDLKAKSADVSFVCLFHFAFCILLRTSVLVVGAQTPANDRNVERSK